MVDIVEHFAKIVESLREHVPGEEVNPNPMFTESDVHSTMHFVPDVSISKVSIAPPAAYNIKPTTDDSGNVTGISVTNAGSGYGEPLAYEPPSEMELVLEDAYNAVTSHVAQNEYDLKVMDEVIADGHGIGFCLGSIRTHVEKFSHFKTYESLYEIIHYASMAMYAMDKEKSA